MKKKNTKNAKQVKPSELPLTIGIEGHQLVIRIGISTLAFCTHAEVGGPLPEKCSVVDKRMWAKHVAAAMKAEEEDGATVINKAIDTAMRDAYYNGSVAIAESARTAPDWRLQS